MRASRGLLISQVVTGVAVRVLLQIFLVVLLGARRRTGVYDLGDDRVLPLARRAHAGLDLLGDAPLLGRRDEYCRSILRAHVVALPVARGRIVHAEEPLLQQVGVRKSSGIEDNAHRLGVAGGAGVNIFITGVRGLAAG